MLFFNVLLMTSSMSVWYSRIELSAYACSFEFSVPIMFTHNAQCRPVYSSLHASAGTGDNTCYLTVSSLLPAFV